VRLFNITVGNDYRWVTGKEILREFAIIAPDITTALVEASEEVSKLQAALIDLYVPEEAAECRIKQIAEVSAELAGRTTINHIHDHCPSLADSENVEKWAKRTASLILKLRSE
jgi:hypothetical protein